MKQSIRGRREDKDLFEWMKARDSQARKRMKDAAQQVLSYGSAAQQLLKLLPRGGRGSKTRRTVGRIAETLNFGILAAVCWT